MTPQSDLPQSSIEETLTWTDANRLRIMASDYRLDVLGRLLAAEHLGLPGKGALRAQHEEAQRIEAQVLAMFRRMSEDRA